MAEDNKTERLIRDQLRWKRRNDYIWLIESYLNNEIDGYSFARNFEMEYLKDEGEARLICLNPERLSEFSKSIDENLSGFSVLLYQICNYSYSYQNPPDFDESSEDFEIFSENDTSEEELREVVKKAYREISLFIKNHE